MSIKVMTAVWEYSAHKGSDLLLLLAIADHADDAGVAYPSVPNLARKTRMTDRNVQLRLRALSHSKELDIHLYAGPKRSHLFRVKIQGENFSPTDNRNIAPPQSKGEKFSGVKSFQGEISGSPGVKFPVQNPAPSSLSPSDSPSYISPVPEPSEEPSIRAREATRKKSATPRRQKTPFPSTPAAQVALKTSILNTAFETWYAGTGLREVLVYPDLAWQWEQFSLDAETHGRVYTSWRAAFQKWLGSKYQERKKTTSTPPVDLMAWAQEQDRLEQERTP